MTPQRLLFVVVLIVGVGLRVSPYFADLEESNVRAFYFQRSAELVEHGSLPAIDRWGFAPDVYPENTPPMLAYFSLFGFRLWRFLGGADDFRLFANWFPVFVFVLWITAAFLFLNALFKERFATAIILFLLGVSWSALEVTGYGQYFEETIGVPLLFFSVLSFAFLDRARWVFWVGLISLTALVLSWQIFPLFFVAALCALIISFVWGDRQNWKRRMVLLTIPVIGGEVLTRLGGINAYSVLGMFREMWLGFWGRHSADLLIAMYRNDWQDMGFSGFLKYYGYLGIFLSVVGLLVALLRIKEISKIAAFVFGAVGFAGAFQFVKLRHLAFGLFAGLWAVGALAVVAPEPYWPRLSALGRAIRSAATHIVCNRTRRAIILTVCVLVILGSVWWYYGIPDPEGRVVVESKSQGDASSTREVTIWLENNGGRTSHAPQSFAGLHVEVEGADILASSLRDAPENSDIGTKTYAGWGKVYFFEAKLSRLLSKQKAGVTLVLRERPNQVARLYVRGWLPKHRCSLEDRREGTKDLLPSWQDIKNGWRNEKCIVRIPANSDASEPLCLVKVFAAHTKQQDFRCLVKEI